MCIEEEEEGLSVTQIRVKMITIRFFSARPLSVELFQLKQGRD